MTSPHLSAEAVIADAADLADASGFDAVTLSAVARRLGVRTPSLYSHIRDLAALRDGITALALGELSDVVAVAIAGRSGKLALRGLADAHRTYSTRSPGRWQSLQRRAGPTAVESGAARRLVTLTDAVLLGYGLSAVDRVHATRLIGSTINGFLTLERVGSFDHSTPAPGASWTVALDALDTLLASWPRTSHDEPPQ
ncbi:TetR-like C-terminal domain-containing protein [Arthrobacter sp. CG_A4]|uniref:TetR-like C-terminal domain-containing protein n=1 Tax=Arthrobacter sp. CG_A4 TaxID=3071706 RepID=UPI002DF7D5E8|nr:AcrR family transcriptional regulator [Arthrobacter sp. CG_A4]